MEILLNQSHLGDDFYTLARDAKTTLTRFFRRLFKAAGSDLSASEETRLAELIIATLRGLATANAIFPLHTVSYKGERAMLKDMVLARVRGA